MDVPPCISWFYAFCLAILCVPIMLEALILPKRHFQLWTNTYCRNGNVAATKDYYNTRSLSACASRCRQNPGLCYGFSFYGNLCSVYEFPRPSVFRECETEEKPISFFIWNEFTNSEADFVTVQNMALFKPTSMSSTHFSRFRETNERKLYYAYSRISVDGSFSKALKTESSFLCAVTKAQYHPWWRVDLLDVFVVIEVTIFTLAELGVLDDFEVRVGMVDIAIQDVPNKLGPFTGNDICGSVSQGAQAIDEIHVVCDPSIEGRFVTIQKMHSCKTCKVEQHLSLCEVSVWAYPSSTMANLNRAYLKPVTMSDVLSDKDNPFYFPYYATDGFHSNFNRFFSATTGDFLHPWIMIDLWNEFMVDRVIICNKIEEHQVSLEDLEIRIGLTPINQTYSAKVFEANTLCLSSSPQSVTPGLFVVIQCDPPITGRYVTIQKINRICSDAKCGNGRLNILSLQEVYVYGLVFPLDLRGSDLALGKPVLQSSEGGKNFAAVNAVDGNKNFQIRTGNTFCAKTHQEDRLPWWRVDLLNFYVVTAVVIHNAEKTEQTQLHDFEIRVGFHLIEKKPFYKAFDKNPLCVAIKDKFNKVVRQGSNHFKCQKPLRGRYVSIEITQLCLPKYCTNSLENVLTLCEVEVIGQLLPRKQLEVYNVALNKTATQSSTWFPEVPASLAVDGQWSLFWKTKDGKYMCTHTNPRMSVDPFPWWQVDFGGKTLVKAVSIFNRGEMQEWWLRDFEIRVGFENLEKQGKGQHSLNDLCNKWENKYLPQGWNHFSCLRLKAGKFLSIQIVRACTRTACIENSGNVLTLCEVQVWGFEDEDEDEASETEYNVALLQSSIYHNSKKPLSSFYANDGYITCWSLNNRTRLGCSIFADDVSPWWRVDLDEEFEIERISLTVLNLIEHETKYEIELRVGDADILGDNISETSICANVTDSLDSEMRETFRCRSRLKGQFVAVQIRPCKMPTCQNGNRLAVALLEVEVWAEMESSGSLPVNDSSHRNLAFNKRVIQSSYLSSPFLATGETKNLEQFFNHRDLLGSCSITQEEVYPWWRVDLAEIFLVEKVSVNLKSWRKETTENLQNILSVRVGCADMVQTNVDELTNSNQVCTKNQIDWSSSSTRTLFCETPKIGRYVSIHLLDDCDHRRECLFSLQQLVLCHFEVFGKFLAHLAVSKSDA